MLCGIDEAGRGPLAGPLVVSSVIFTKKVDGLRDSKKLTPKRREELCKKILENSIYTILFFSNKKIDTFGLSKNLTTALKTILKRCDKLGDVRYIFDGNCSYGVDRVEHLIKADESIDEVSAASIVAKVYRDRYMQKISKKYPIYRFDKHKGYGTKEHIELIRENGYSKIHRKSFVISKL